MSQPLAFSLNLTGTFAAALAPVNAGIGQAIPALERARGAVGSFEGSMNSLGGSGILSRVGSFFTFDIAQGAQLAVNALRAVGAAFFDLGKKIAHTLGEEQDINLALKLNVGDEKAKEVQALADSFGNTRFDDSAIKKSVLPLLSGGIKDMGLIDDLATAAADVSAIQATGQEGYQAAMDAFASIGLRREVNAKMLKSLDINDNDFYARLARQQGTSIAAARKLTADGKFTGQQLLDTVLEERAAKQGGSLGDPSLRANQTWGATLQHLSDLSGNVFKKLENSPGLEKIRKSIESIIDSLKGDLGDKIMKQFDGIFTKLSTIITPENIERWATTFSTALESVGDIATVVSDVGGFLWTVIEGVGEALGEAAAEVYLFFEALTELGASIGDSVGEAFVALVNFGDSAIAWVKDLGTNLWQGLRDGILGGVDALTDAVKSLGHGVVDTFKDVLGISSPSKVFAQLGDYSAQGFALGMDRSADRAAESARRSVGDIVGSVSGANGGITGAGVTVQVTQNFNVGSGTPSEQAAEFGHLVRVEFVKIMEEVDAKFGLVAA